MGENLMTAAELHAHFCRATGAEKLTLSYQRMQTWSDFVARGLTCDDLDLVIRWTRAQATRGEGGFSALSLQWGAMVGDLDKFEDRLNVARHSRFARKAAPSPVAVTAAPAATPADPEPSQDDIRRLADDFFRSVGRPREAQA